MLKLDFEQEKIKEQERLQKKIEKNKKIIFMSGFFILIAILLLVILIAFVKLSDKPKVIIDNTKVNLTHVNGKLAKYIENLGNVYTVRYLGISTENHIWHLKDYPKNYKERLRT